MLYLLRLMIPIHPQGQLELNHIKMPAIMMTRYYHLKFNGCSICKCLFSICVLRSRSDQCHDAA